MSAQVIAFPSNARALNERLRAVRTSIADRAKDVGATLEQKSQAQAAAMRVMDGGGSAAWAIAVAKDMLPRPQLLAYRQPTTGPEAA